MTEFITKDNKVIPINNSKKGISSDKLGLGNIEKINIEPVIVNHSGKQLSHDEINQLSTRQQRFDALKEKHGGKIPEYTFGQVTDYINSHHGKAITIFSVDGERWYIVKQMRFNDRESLKGLWLVMDFQDFDGNIIGGFPIKDDKDWSRMVEHGQLQGFDKNGIVIDMRLKERNQKHD